MKAIPTPSKLTTHADFRQVCHIVSGNQLRRAAAAIVNVQDNVAFGPCAADPAEHARRRAEHWQEIARSLGPDALSPRPAEMVADAEQLTRVVTANEMPLVIWTSTTWRQDVQLCWVVDRLDRLGVRADRCFIALVTPPSPGFPLEALTHAELLPAFDQRARLMPDAFVACAELWRLYGGADPTAVVLAAQHAAETLPALASHIGEYLRAFPQEAQGGARLSELDDAILEVLDQGGWIHGDRLSDDGRIKRLWLYPGNLWPLWYRVNQWCEGSLPAIEVEPNSETAVPWLRRYRLTSRGRELRAPEGTSSLDAPEMLLGGYPLYGASKRYLRSADGAGLVHR